MIRLEIDGQMVMVEAGTTLLQAATSLGIRIPTMCYQPGCHSHPSCMVCMVKDLTSNQLVPSCAMPASEGMRILTCSDEVLASRREALKLLLSDHSGDCEAPCRLACPAMMDIPLVNRQLAEGKLEEALEVVRQEIALPAILGYICPAPCEKVCKRKPIDGAVTISLLERSAAIHGERGGTSLVGQNVLSGKKVAIIGAGPAGLAAAYHLLLAGFPCTIFDENPEPGGRLRSIPQEELPRHALEQDLRVIREMGAIYVMNTCCTGPLQDQAILTGFDAILFAPGFLSEEGAAMFGFTTGAQGHWYNRFNHSTSIAGTFAAPSPVEERMAVRSVARGKSAAREIILFLETGNYPDFNVPMADLPARSVSTLGPLTENEWPEYLAESTGSSPVQPAGGRSAGYSVPETVEEARRCMHCDCRRPVSCKLREWSEFYHVHRRRMPGMERSRVTRVLQHDLVVFETEKCIRCGLCVEISGRAGEDFGLSFSGRGYQVRVRTPFDKPMSEALTTAAREVVKACPTGALAYRDNEERH